MLLYGDASSSRIIFALEEEAHLKSTTDIGIHAHKH